jgi:hypothetical protein
VRLLVHPGGYRDSWKIKDGCVFEKPVSSRHGWPVNIMRRQGGIFILDSIASTINRLGFGLKSPPNSIRRAETIHSRTGELCMAKILAKRAIKPDRWDRVPDRAPHALKETEGTLIRIAMLFAIAAIGSAPSHLSGASLDGVTLPDTVQAGSAPLVLNGLGVRTKFAVKVYIAGLYLQQKSSDANAVIKAEAPKQIVMHFVHGASKSQMADAFREGFDDNTPDAKRTMKPEIDRLLGALDSVKDGDLMTFTYIPGKGSSYAINGNEKLTIAGPAFGQVLFSVWLGPKPPNDNLKKGMLGQ